MMPVARLEVGAEEAEILVMYLVLRVQVALLFLAAAAAAGGITVHKLTMVVLAVLAYTAGMAVAVLQAVLLVLMGLFPEAAEVGQRMITPVLAPPVV